MGTVALMTHPRGPIPPPSGALLIARIGAGKPPDQQRDTFAVLLTRGKNGLERHATTIRQVATGIGPAHGLITIRGLPGRLADAYA